MQSFERFELILVNDGSLDESGEICRECAQNDSRVTVIYKENEGVSSARNAGLAISKGEYIIFVDGDDYIDAEMIATLYRYALLHESDIVACDLQKVNSDGISLDSRQEGVAVKQFTNIEALQRMFSRKGSQYTTKAGNNVVWVIITAKLYKRHLFNNLHFTEGMICEDEMIAHELLFKAKEITYIQDRFYYYVQRKNSTINSPFSTKRFDKVYALKERVDFFRKQQLDVLHQQAMKSYVNTFFWNYIMARTELGLDHTDLKTLKRTLNQMFPALIYNPLISWKQKVYIGLFIINPKVLDWDKRQDLKSKNVP
jgi:glycosyltransferase involved in cell wall biosynthesis